MQAGARGGMDASCAGGCWRAMRDGVVVGCVELGGGEERELHLSKQRATCASSPCKAWRGCRMQRSGGTVRPENRRQSGGGWVLRGWCCWRVRGRFAACRGGARAGCARVNGGLARWARHEVEIQRRGQREGDRGIEKTLCALVCDRLEMGVV